jgi:hypothetical protein
MRHRIAAEHAVLIPAQAFAENACAQPEASILNPGKPWSSVVCDLCGT